MLRRDCATRPVEVAARWGRALLERAGPQRTFLIQGRRPRGRL